jgi:hypothetical protein
MPHDAAMLRRLADAALREGDARPLEDYLLASADDPGVSEAFAGVIGALVTAPDPPVERIEALLDGWAALSPEEAPRDDPRARLPATALRCYGQVAVARPDWWGDEIAKLRRGTADRRPWSQASLRAALGQMFAADPERTRAALVEWRASGDPQAAGVAVAVLTMAELG